MRTAIEMITRGVRLYRPDGNELRRSVDLVESAAVAVAFMLLVFALGPVIAIAQQAYQAEPSRGVHQVQATVLENAPLLNLSRGENASAEPVVQARWSGPAGEQLAGLMPVPAGTRAGARASAWVDDYGAPASPPADPVVRWLRAVTVALLVLLGVGALLWVGVWMARRLLDRRRYADWDRQWAAADERWRHPRQGR